MRYVNINQITEFLVEETKPMPEKWHMETAYKITIKFVDGTSVFERNKTREECIALAEKLGLTLID